MNIPFGRWLCVALVLVAWIGNSGSIYAQESLSAKQSTWFEDKPPEGKVENEFDYATMLYLTRQLLSRESVRKFLNSVFSEELKVTDEIRKAWELDLGDPGKKAEPVPSVKEMSETQFILLLRFNPEFWPKLQEFIAQVPDLDEKSAESAELVKKWGQEFLAIIKDENLLKEFALQNDPGKPLLLVTKDGRPGYSNLKIFANHPVEVNGQLVPSSDLLQIVTSSLANAKSSISLAVYDLDITEIRDVLIAAVAAKKRVVVSLDAKIVKSKPKVKKLAAQLKAAGVLIHPVISTGKMHQKMISIDSDLPGQGKVVLLSGNMTYSDLTGDLPYANPRPRLAIPNANHLVTMDSDIMANLVHHEIMKAAHPNYRLVGKQYPLGGAYQIYGPKPEGSEKAPYFISAFSPRGGFGDINFYIVARMLVKTSGPLYIGQFSFAAEDVERALLARAKRDIEQFGKFDLFAVVDRSSATQDWSVLLRMSGLKKEDGKAVEIDSSIWREVLGPERFAQLQDAIRIAPPEYSVHRTRVGDELKTVQARFHHKVMASGEFAIAGTSFNLGESAETNQDYLGLWKDAIVTAFVKGIVLYNWKRGAASVLDFAKKNKKKIRRVNDSETESGNGVGRCSAVVAA